mgnify:CR=1 FL=1
MSIDVGQRLPTMTLRNQDNELVRLASLHEDGPLVLFFYPADHTPTCTREVGAFRDAFEAFGELGATVAGVSGDPFDTHRSFCDAQRLPYPLLSDEDDRLRNKMGVPSRFFGMMPGRVTYVIDQNGRIRDRHVAHGADKEHVDHALLVVRHLVNGSTHSAAPPRQ